MAEELKDRDRCLFCVCVSVFHNHFGDMTGFIVIFCLVSNLSCTYLISDASFLSLLYHEHTNIHTVSLLRGLKHSNIVTLHDIIHTEKSLTLVFEYLVRGNEKTI